MRTDLNPKLIVLLTTIAIFAPVASAQARYWAVRSAGHVAVTQPDRHWGPRGAEHPAIRLQRDGRVWN